MLIGGVKDILLEQGQAGGDEASQGGRLQRKLIPSVLRLQFSRVLNEGGSGGWRFILQLKAQTL